MKSFYFGEVLCLLSAGFSASFGISHIRLNFATPGMRFSSHSFCTRLSEMPYSTAREIFLKFLVVDAHAALLAAQKQDAGAVADNGFRMVFVDGL